MSIIYLLSFFIHGLPFLYDAQLLHPTCAKLTTVLHHVCRYRVCQIVTNNEDLQDYAATTCFKFLNSPTVHENGVKVAAYILGEFGHQIQDKQVTGPKLFDCLRCKFPTSEPDTKALILSAYIKMSNTYPELKEVRVGKLTAVDHIEIASCTGK